MTNETPTKPRREQSERYNPDEIEAKWQARWEADDLYRTPDDDPRPKWYALTMLPYTSGDLHVGHWYAMAPSDANARFKRMNGYNVLFPMGFDAFGLPAENAAIKNHRHPAEWTSANVDRMRGQLKSMGAMFDWSRELTTASPDYYKWTQWWFLQLLKHDLAYKKRAAVWWCPKDQTVLANEQVVDGKCERCDSPVSKRDLEQWFFRITKYAEELLDFSKLQWTEQIAAMQRNWIGKSDGAELRFGLDVPGVDTKEIRVFTTRPDTVYGVTFFVVAPEHPLVEQITTPEQRDAVRAYVESARRESDIERMSTEREKTGVFTGAYVTNLFNGEKVPIWIGGLRARDVRHRRRHGRARARPARLRVREEVRPEDRPRVHAPGLGRRRADRRVRPRRHDDQLRPLRRHAGRGRVRGGGEVRRRPRLRSRHGELPPARLAHLAAALCGARRSRSSTARRTARCPCRRPTCPCCCRTTRSSARPGESPLTYHEGFLHTTCPVCGGPARRETDTMDTFMCSSWYQMRYIDPHNDERPFSRELAKKWLPVDQYTGGAEHAVMHLLYTRFFTKAARDMGVVDIDEPMVRLFNQGQILGPDGQRMSKSRGNVIAPDGEVAKWGADTFRAYLMFLGPWDGGGPYDASGISGVYRWLNRAWNAVTGGTRTGAHADAPETRELRRWTHKTIAKVTEDIARLPLQHDAVGADGVHEPPDAPARVGRGGRRGRLARGAGVDGAAAGAERPAHRGGAVVSARQAVQRPHTAVAAVRRGARGGRRRRDRRAGQRQGPRPPDAPRRRARGCCSRRRRWRAPSVTQHVEGKEIVRVIYVPNRLLNIVVR